MATLTRRRGRDEDPEETERPARRRRSPSGDDKGAGVADEPVRRSRRSRDEEPEDEAPVRSRRSRREEPEEEEPPARGRGRRSSAREEKPARRRSGGADAYASLRKAQGSSKFADEFKPASDTPTLIKILDAEPFDVYNQHWIDEGDAAGKTRHSFVCLNDEFYFDDVSDGCPLCDVQDNPSTYALYNVLNLGNPKKPVVEVWKCSVTVADKLDRLAKEDKTSPLDREDLYFEVTLVKTKNKTTWDITPIKARDLAEDFKVDPFDAEELAEFEDEMFDDRKAITQVDSWDDLDALAESL